MVCELYIINNSLAVDFVYFYFETTIVLVVGARLPRILSGSEVIGDIPDNS